VALPRRGTADRPRSASRALSGAAAWVHERDGQATGRGDPSGRDGPRWPRSAPDCSRGSRSASTSSAPPVAFARPSCTPSGRPTSSRRPRGAHRMRRADRGRQHRAVIERAYGFDRYIALVDLLAGGEPRVSSAPRRAASIRFLDVPRRRGRRGARREAGERRSAAPDLGRRRARPSGNGCWRQPAPCANPGWARGPLSPRSSLCAVAVGSLTAAELTQTPAAETCPSGWRPTPDAGTTSPSSASARRRRRWPVALDEHRALRAALVMAAVAFATTRARCSPRTRANVMPNPAEPAEVSRRRVRHRA
jgi:hypothetical protein